MANAMVEGEGTGLIQSLQAKTTLLHWPEIPEPLDLQDNYKEFPWVLVAKHIDVAEFGSLFDVGAYFAAAAVIFAVAVAVVEVVVFSYQVASLKESFCVFLELVHWLKVGLYS